MNCFHALDHLPLSYELATIKCDVEVESDLDTFKVQEPNKDELIALYGECEFRRWLAELLDNPKDAEKALSKIRKVHNRSAWMLVKSLP